LNNIIPRAGEVELPDKIFCSTRGEKKPFNKGLRNKKKTFEKKVCEKNFKKCKASGVKMAKNFAFLGVYDEDEEGEEEDYY